MGAGETGDEVAERRGARVGEGRGQPERKAAPEGIAVQRGILGGHHDLLVAQTREERASVVHQVLHPRRGITLGAHRDLPARQVPHAAKHVVQLVGTAGTPAVGDALQLELHRCQHLGVEQLAQLLRTEQGVQKVTIERERGCAALRERRVALVHVRRDPVEHEALRERRGLRRVHVHQADAARTDAAEHLAQGGNVEHVLQALPAGLEEHGERGVLRRDRKQVGGPLPLLPQRRSLAGAPPRQQQGTRGAFPEACGEH